jgi:hypothetical protein
MTIERRGNLSYMEFSETYLYPNKPVIVTDALREWRALSRWSPEFFRTEFGDMEFTINDAEYGQPEYAAGADRQFTMRQFIDCVMKSTEESPAPYFRNKIFCELFPSLKHDIEPLPQYIFPNWLPERFALKRVSAFLNRGAAIEVYIGGRGAAFPVLHFDGAGTHAFLMQVFGRKQYIVYSPDQEPFLYVSPNKRNLSLLNSVDRPDLEKFPLFAKAVPTTFVLEPGELLFVPSHWWHTARILSPSITISVNVVNESNWHELIQFVANRRRNPVVSLASRVYLSGAGTWRSWRDRKLRQGPAAPKR